MCFVSIITITYNAELFLERTLKSIKKQTCDDYEYIVVDGASKDGTLQLAEAYHDIIDSIISEKDQGLYDAMNKGLKLAKGKYVWFMNAGDEIAHNTVIEDLKTLAKDESDVLYGDTILVNDQGDILGMRSEIGPHKLPKNLSWTQYGLGMLVCHQAFIPKKAIAPSYNYNNLSADIDWEIRCLKKACKVAYYEKPLAKYLEGGVSHQSLLKSWIDRYKVLNKHFGFLKNIQNHFRILLRADYKNIFRLLKYFK
jgi:glycosyltransferase involved in cell wall biosynthesis